MADTALPSITTVNDAQLAAMMECYGSVPAWKQRMVQHIIQDIRRYKQAEIQVIYQERLAELDTQEQNAMAAVESMLANLVVP